MWRIPFGSDLACALAGLTSVAAAAGQADIPPNPTAEQIVERNVAARGGLDAWRRIQTMVWSGHIQTDNPAASIEAFTFELKRPNKTRFEIKTDHEKTLRVFDGVSGWKEHTSSTEGPTLRRYSPRELRSARDAQGIDGLLIDHETKGIKLALEGTDEVDRHRAYRLGATLPSGATRHVWVDAQTFLDLKYDRELRAAGGRTKTVSVFYRNYRTIDGVQLPMTIETRTEGRSGSEKLTIDDVTLNPSLSDAHFEKPNLPQRRKAHPDSRSASGAELKVPAGPKLGAGGPVIDPADPVPHP